VVDFEDCQWLELAKNRVERRHLVLVVLNIRVLVPQS